MILGFVLLVVGIVLSFTGVGLIVGVPMIVAGVLLLILNFLKAGASMSLGAIKLGAKATAGAARSGHRAATTKACPDCRSQIPSSAIVCASCGYRYGPGPAPWPPTIAEQPLPAAPVVAQATCPQCGQASKAAARFCTHCGMELGAVTA